MNRTRKAYNSFSPSEGGRETDMGKAPYKKKGRTTGPAFSHGTLENKARQQHNHFIINRIPS